MNESELRAMIALGEQKLQEQKKERQGIEPLIQTIRQQESLLTEQSALNKSLSEENEKLLKLSEQERKLNLENSNLKQNVEKLQSELERKEQEIVNLTRQAKDLADKYKQLSQTFSSTEEIQTFSDVFRKAEKVITNTYVLNIGNYFVVGVFVILVAFAGWQVYWCRQDIKSVSESMQSVKNALYNTNGYSVLDGTVSSEQVYKQNTLK